MTAIEFADIGAPSWVQLTADDRRDFRKGVKRALKDIRKEGGDTGAFNRERPAGYREGYGLARRAVLAGDIEGYEHLGVAASELIDPR